MPKLPRFEYVDADELPNLTFEFEEQDLTAFASIALRLRRPDGKLLTKTAVIDDAPNGLFHFEWAVGDLMIGLHQADVVFTDPGGKSETFPPDQPLELLVRARV